jgi:hypothetical protein
MKTTHALIRLRDDIDKPEIMELLGRDVALREMGLSVK